LQQIYNPIPARLEKRTWFLSAKGGFLSLPHNHLVFLTKTRYNTVTEIKKEKIPMEEKFIAAWAAAREKAAALDVRMRPVAPEDALKTARRKLSGSRLSDGFTALQGKGRLDLSLEALVIDKRFTGLFTDEEANEALTRLLEAGYRFR